MPLLSQPSGVRQLSRSCRTTYRQGCLWGGLWLLLAIGGSPADGDSSGSRRDARVSPGADLSWVIQGELDSVVILGPDIVRCGLQTPDFPRCQVWWESEPVGVTDTTDADPYMFLTASIHNPLPGAYRLVPFAHVKTTAYVGLIAHLWCGSGSNSCAVDTTIQDVDLAMPDTIIVRYRRATADSCTLELVHQ